MQKAPKKREREERGEKAKRIGRRGADGWESDPKGLGNGICSVCARPCVCKCPQCGGTQAREGDGERRGVEGGERVYLYSIGVNR